MWELRAILCIPVYIITWQYWDPDQIVPLNYIYSDSQVPKVSSLLLIPANNCSVCPLHCTDQEEDVVAWSRSDVLTRLQTHSLTPSSIPVNTALCGAQTDCLQKMLFSSAGKISFHSVIFYSLDFCWWAWPSSIIVVSGVSWWRAGDWLSDSF